MAEVHFKGQCCECCLVMIANNGDSGCRDYYGHTHRSAKLSDRVVHELNVEHPQFANSTAAR